MCTHDMVFFVIIKKLFLFSINKMYKIFFFFYKEFWFFFLSQKVHKYLFYNIVIFTRVFCSFHVIYGL